MRIKNLMAVVAMLVIGSVYSAASISQTPVATTGTRIAVVDVGFIVKNHPTIKLQQTAIRDRVKAAQDELVKRRETLVKEAEQLKLHKEGSADFNQLQERLANQEAQLKLDMVRKEKELDEVEAKMAIEFYNQLQAIIASIAEHNQISLVLRANRETPDLKQPATIQMALEKGVVYSNPQLDMTKMVLDLIEQQSKASGGVPSGSNAPGSPVLNAKAPPGSQPTNPIR